MEYQQIRKKVQEQQTALEEEYAKLEDLQNDLIAKQTNVESLKASKESEISSISGELEQTNQKLAELQAAAEEDGKKNRKKKKPQLQQQRRTIIVEVREEL